MTKLVKIYFHAFLFDSHIFQENFYVSGILTRQWGGGAEKHYERESIDNWFCRTTALSGWPVETRL